MKVPTPVRHSMHFNAASMSYKTHYDNTFGDIAVLRLWHFGWKTPIRANSRRVFELFTPKIVMSLF